MAKRIKSQNRGKGGPQFQAKNNKSKVKENFYHSWMVNTQLKVLDIITCRNHSSIFMKISTLDNTKTEYIICPSGVISPSIISPYENGSINKIGELSVGDSIFNVQRIPGSSTRLFRAAGVFGKITSKTLEKVEVVRAKKLFSFNINCLCTKGVPAAQGKLLAPLIKASKKILCGKKNPYSVSPSKMNAVDHPFGGNSPGVGRHKECKRTSSPGMKVGNIASRRSGRKR
jgi:large subunit ribosomal protein L2